MIHPKPERMTLMFITHPVNTPRSPVFLSSTKKQIES
jgi:hypothetical protein